LTSYQGRKFPVLLSQKKKAQQQKEEEEEKLFVLFNSATISFLIPFLKYAHLVRAHYMQNHQRMRSALFEDDDDDDDDACNKLKY